ncbi:hypothetical protein RIR_jg40505.t1 [Rhizophagus irregularis DAOM 181602=DAOM 197198]|nr:hypothetical protein RIR_jg40505.t1 [Rhizophagus irregularis DAOM 181602=DAOM 197198]
MKSPTLTLPTLDVLNRNFPGLLQDLLWALLTKNSSHPSILFEDSFRRCELFTWIQQDISTISENKTLTTFYSI